MAQGWHGACARIAAGRAETVFLELLETNNTVNPPQVYSIWHSAPGPAAAELRLEIWLAPPSNISGRQHTYVLESLEGARNMHACSSSSGRSSKQQTERTSTKYVHPSHTCMHAVPRSAGSPRTSQHDSALRRQSSSHPAICATRLPRQSRAPTNTTIHRRYLTAATSLLSPPPSGPPSQLPSADSDLPHPSDTSSPRLASPPPPLPHSTCHFRVRYRLVLACQGGEDTTTPGERREGGSIANTPKSLPTEQAPPQGYIYDERLEKMPATHHQRQAARISHPTVPPVLC